MAVKECGSANVEKVDQSLLINHKLMKLKLHTASNRDSCFRIHLREDNTLMIHEREWGTSWVWTTQGMPQTIQDVIREYLIAHNNRGHYFLRGMEIEAVMKRYPR